MAYIKPETYFCLHETNTFCFTENFINYSTFSQVYIAASKILITNIFHYYT